MAEPASPGTAGNEAQAQADARTVQLLKIYIKDASIEVPGAPKIFASGQAPQIDINVATSMSQINDEQFNVVLNVTVTAKSGEDTAFLVEVQQGGIFLVRGFTNLQEKGAILGGYCPSMLFPFAREAVADFVQKAGFPQLLLQPINFEALYLEHLARQRAEAAAKSAADAGTPAKAH